MQTEDFMVSFPFSSPGMLIKQQMYEQGNTDSVSRLATS